MAIMRLYELFTRLCVVKQRTAKQSLLFVLLLKLQPSLEIVIL